MLQQRDPSEGVGIGRAVRPDQVVDAAGDWFDLGGREPTRDEVGVDQSVPHDDTRKVDVTHEVHCRLLH
jgi:hypothetical protein